MDLAAATEVIPVQHVPGVLNPADIATRPHSVPEDVMEDSVWQSGPAFLSLPRAEWPLSRVFLDRIPDQELRSPKAVFNLADPIPWCSWLGRSIDSMITQVMERSNSYGKTVNVTARLLRCLFSSDKEQIIPSEGTPRSLLFLIFKSIAAK